MEQEYWLVVAEDETYHQTPDDAENLHRIGLPIVDGPFDEHDDADAEAIDAHVTVVSLPKGTVTGWDE